VGSPGASFPIKDHIANLIRHYVPEVTTVKLVAATATDRAPAGEPVSSPAANVQRILDERINPAVRDHGGAITLVEVKGDTAFLRLEGGCQGCAMAEVTLRQGVEVMIREQVPGIVTIVDTTDHAGGTNPYFKTRKGPS
jgi:Fe-S cluster biogenesis protein NfuA